MKDSPLASYAWQSQKSQQVIYIGSDGNIWEISWKDPDSDPINGGKLWQKIDLSQNTGFTGRLGPKLGSSIVGCAFEHEGTKHVFYIDGNNDICELYYSGGKWVGNNLSNAATAHPPAANSPLAGYVCAYENTQHVVYIGADGDIHEIYWSNGWKPEQSLTNITSTPKPAGNSALVGYACEYERTQHVIYIDNNSKIQELYRRGTSWLNTEISTSAGSGATPPLTTASPLAGYAFENQGTHHVIYLDANQQIHELYRSGNAWNAGEVSKS